MAGPVVVPTRPGQPAPPRDADWRQYRGDMRKSGLAWWHSPLPSGHVVWRLGAGPMIDASPVVGGDGVIYVGGAQYLILGPGDPVAPWGLVAVNPNGTLRWRLILRAGNSYYEVRAAPAVRADGRIVVVGGNWSFPKEGGTGQWRGKGRVFLVSAAGTIEHWSDEYEGPGVSSPAVDPQDNTYFWSLPPGKPTPYCMWKIDRDFAGSTDIGGIAPNWTSGGSDWRRFLPGTGSHASDTQICPPLIPSPALGGYDDAVGTANKTIRCKISGRNLYEKDASGLTTPAVGNGGRAYLVTGRSLEAWDLNGSRRWKTDLNSPPAAPPALGAAEGTMEADYVPKIRYPDGTRPATITEDHRFGRSSSSPLDIYVALQNGYLQAFDYKGKSRWRVSVPGSPHGAPICVQNLDTHEQRIIIGSCNGMLLGLNRDGQLLWQVQLDSEILGSPAAANGCLYVATRTSLYAIR